MYEYRATLDKVIDGDTIDVVLNLGFDITVKHRLRIKDVDTEELRDPDPELREKAMAAKWFVFEHLKDKPLIVRTFKTRSGTDRRTFGRYVAEVIFDEVVDGTVVTLNLGEELVKEGYAKRI